MWMGSITIADTNMSLGFRGLQTQMSAAEVHADFVQIYAFDSQNNLCALHYSILKRP